MRKSVEKQKKLLNSTPEPGGSVECILENKSLTPQNFIDQYNINTPKELSYLKKQEENYYDDNVMTPVFTKVKSAVHQKFVSDKNRKYSYILWFNVHLMKIIWEIHDFSIHLKMKFYFYDSITVSKS